LSALLARCLTGVHPFAGTGVQRLVAIHGGDRSPWTGPPALGPVFDRALPRDPGARASAAEVAAALGAALVLAVPPPPPPPASTGLLTMQDVAAAMRLERPGEVALLQGNEAVAATERGGRSGEDERGNQSPEAPASCPRCASLPDDEEALVVLEPRVEGPGATERDDIGA